jgi:hypothetical protein
MTEKSCGLLPIGVTLLRFWSWYRGPNSVGVFPSILRLRGQKFIPVDTFLEEILCSGVTSEIVKPMCNIYSFLAVRLLSHIQGRTWAGCIPEWSGEKFGPKT